MELSNEVKPLICCSVDGCNTTNRDDVITKRNGVPYCQRHYAQIKRYGKIIHVEPVHHGVKVCDFCGRKVSGTLKTLIGFLCSTHYSYYKKYGHLDYRGNGHVNEIIDNGDGTSSIYLYDIDGNCKDKSIIDTEDTKNISIYRWKKSHFGYVVSITQNIKLHRIIMGLDNNDKRVVDHINGNKLDNRKCNLRICTRRENVWHKTKLSSNNTSGYIGVSYSKERRKWVAQIHLGNKGIYLGRYDNIEDAIAARKEAEEKYFGEYKSTINYDRH